MSNKVGIWKDAPEGTEFIVEFDDGEIHYYKTIGVTLCVCTPESKLVTWSNWRLSCFTDLEELIMEDEVGRKEIHFKPE